MVERAAVVRECRLTSRMVGDPRIEAGRITVKGSPICRSDAAQEPLGVKIIAACLRAIRWDV
jgi:hypothetical protein